MHAFFMPPSLDQQETRHWIEHILGTHLQTFIIQLKSSFLLALRSILFLNLQSSSLSIVSDDCVLLAIIYHFIFYEYILSLLPV
jgi:hypothetical protein